MQKKPSLPFTCCPFYFFSKKLKCSSPSLLPDDDYMQIKICRGHDVASMKITSRILLDAKREVSKFPVSVTSQILLKPNSSE